MASENISLYNSILIDKHSDSRKVNNELVLSNN